MYGLKRAYLCEKRIKLSKTKDSHTHSKHKQLYSHRNLTSNRGGGGEETKAVFWSKEFVSLQDWIGLLERWSGGSLLGREQS